MAFDYKKEYKEFYLPPKKPGIIEIPEMNYIAVKGRGNPNVPDGDYKKAIGLLYGIAFIIKMSYKGPYKINGYFSYVVPPLEGLWWQEGLCVQCMHIGSYDQESETIRKMEAYAAEEGYGLDFSATRRHHEIYLSDPRRAAEERLRTVIRHPIKAV